MKAAIRNTAIRGKWLTVAVGIAAASIACDDGTVPVPEHPDMHKSTATVRAARRAYDGAPPVAAHEDFGIECTACHTMEGVDLADVGFAPPIPHVLDTKGGGRFQRCRQCHVFETTDEVFAASSFVGLRQDLRRGKRLHEEAPPVIPHQVLLRENCMACHTGPAAREEIRCPHPERLNCRQCHVERVATNAFARP